uniref:uracil-DNA glycosylase n=1 Tax=Buchnera aphidicola TaxID=9 RepID=UPI003F5D168D
MYPRQEDVFYAFHLTPFESIKVVIIGQDPYHNTNQAHGLAFSVRFGLQIPPSLKNIYHEVTENFNLPKDYYFHGCLSRWARQGVLLLNSILTVESGKPRSHVNLGWEKFTDQLIYYINTYLNNVIFLLWGQYAQQKRVFINSNKHIILCASHPSPLSAYRGFFGCRHFIKTNNILLEQKKNVIFW